MEKTVVAIESLLPQLQEIVQPENVLSETPRLSEIGDRGGWEATPLYVVRPTTTGQIAAIVGVAEASGTAILPCGGGTKLHIGYPPPANRPTLLLDLSLLNRITDFQPEDLTITCEPGATLADVQARAATGNLFLALDAPLPQQATMGGIVSTNIAGFWRPTYGTPRDLLIGLQAVMTDSKQIKGGGKVVKNVAGYDVCKLFTGAYGTVGVLTELTFRLRTLPAQDRAFAWRTPDLQTAAKIGFQMHHARLAPAYLLATNELDGKASLVVGLHGSSSRVDWQRDQFQQMVTNAGVTEQVAEVTDSIAKLRDQQARLSSETPIACTIHLLPSDVVGLLKALEASELFTTAHLATGGVSLALPSADATLVRRILTAMPENAHIVWTRLSADLREREQVAVWGKPREEFVLHRALKAALDPKQTFSPKRFLGNL
jgi:glycolate oxidase FAD binding subunit